MSARSAPTVVLCLLLAPAFAPVFAPVFAQSTTILSASSGGVQGNGDSTLSANRAITPDGRYVVFASHANNLVAGDLAGWQDVFLRDLQTGTVERISLTSSEVEPNNASFDGVVSDDGRFVAFVSSASNLASGDFNFLDDVFVRDRVTGLTTIVSASVAGVIGNAASGRPSISADGLRIAFQSASSNLVLGDTNGKVDVFVRNLVNNATKLISVPAAGGVSDGDSFAPSISGDGRWVAFETTATDLVPGDVLSFREILVRDFGSSTIERVSLTSTGSEANGDSFQASISFDGSRVAFASQATDLGAPSGTHVYLRDRSAGTTNLVDRVGLTPGNGTSQRPVISSNGGFVTYTSQSTNLVGNDPGNVPDAYLTNLATLLHQRASVTTAPAPTDPSQPVDATGGATDNGRFVLFASRANNLANGDTGSFSDVFLRDLERPWYRDFDADTYGDATNFVIASVPPPGYVGDSTDCDDNDPAVNPGQTEICNGIDDDCDQAVDEIAWSAYCDTSVSQNGCQPRMSASGFPSASNTSGFLLQVSDVDGQRSGSVVYGFGQVSLAWAFGSTSTRCVTFPWIRISIAHSTGTVGQCDGDYAVDFLAFMAANPGAPGNPLAAGQTYYTQGWYRDGGAVKHSNLTDAVTFTLCP